jgi:hypothetical protein
VVTARRSPRHLSRQRLHTQPATHEPPASEPRAAAGHAAHRC